MGILSFDMPGSARAPRSSMPRHDFLKALRDVMARRLSREARAKLLADAIRVEGGYRWVGIYDLDSRHGLVLNLAWSGPSALPYPSFALTKGLTARAIAQKRSIHVGDVEKDPEYLTAPGSARAEIIVPVLVGDLVMGTIDVESEHPNAFDAAAERRLEECAAVLRGLWAGAA